MESPAEALVTRWRDEADEYERDGALVPAARLLRRVADELENAVPAYRLEPLTVKQAARESGYSESRLRDYLNNGTVPNAGEPGAPRIRRCDLPRKPAHTPSGGEHVNHG